MVPSRSFFRHSVRACMILVPLSAMAVSSVGCGDSEKSGNQVVPVPEQAKAANNAMEEFMKNQSKAKK